MIFIERIEVREDHVGFDATFVAGLAITVVAPHGLGTARVAFRALELKRSAARGPTAYCCGARSQTDALPNSVTSISSIMSGSHKTRWNVWEVTLEGLLAGMMRFVVETRVRDSFRL